MEGKWRRELRRGRKGKEGKERGGGRTMGRGEKRITGIIEQKHSSHFIERIE